MADSSLATSETTGDIAAGMGKARDQAGGYRIARKGNHDRGVARPVLRRLRGRITGGNDHIDVLGDKVVYEAWQLIDQTLPGAALEGNRLAFDIAPIRKAAYDIRPK